jgi:hypothetical protein
MLKEGYDHFEITKVPPKVDVCERRYVFNQIPEPGRTFQPAAACPAATQPENLTVAYRSYQASYDSAFATALAGQGKTSAPAPSIAGVKEAALVADWSRRRARGEKVTREPPTLERPHILASEQPAPAARPAPTPMTTASVPAPSPAAPAPVTSEPATQEAQAAATPEAAPAPQTSMRKRLLGMFGG